MPIGFLPLARPTARDADGWPIWSASCAVGDRLAVGDGLQGGPDPALEQRCPSRASGRSKSVSSAVEVLAAAGAAAAANGSPPGRRAAPNAARRGGRCRCSSMYRPVRAPPCRDQGERADRAVHHGVRPVPGRVTRRHAGMHRLASWTGRLPGRIVGGHPVDGVVAGGPQVLDGVGAPGPPGGGAPGQRGGRGGQAERPRRRPDAEVGRGERVRVAEPAHGDRLDASTGRARAARPAGPGLAASRCPTSRSISPLASAAASAAKVCRGATAAGARLAGSAAASAAGLGEQAGEPARRVVGRLAVRGGQPAGVGAGRRGRDLLAEHRPERRTPRGRPCAAPGGPAPCRPAAPAPRRRAAGRPRPPGRRPGRAAAGTG